MKTLEIDSLPEKSHHISKANIAEGDYSALDYLKRVGQPIAAVATAAGGPLGVIRLSGTDLTKFSQLFSLGIPQAGHFHFTKVLDLNKKTIDEAIVLYFKAPHSFTGENVIEIQGHGIQNIQEAILSSLCELGAMRALPGEFSFRAVLNQKMSLADAENLQVAFKKDGLNAHVAAQLIGNGTQFTASLNKIFDELLGDLFTARGRVEAAIDFSEAEEEQAADIEGALSLIKRTQESVYRLLTHYENFSATAGEPSVVILGEPNVGKSTLFNILVGEERALVSDVAGTTRDWVESRVKTSARRTLRILDTAGLRDLTRASNEELVSHQELERQGIKKSLLAAELAKIIIWVERADEAASVEAKKTKEQLQNKFANKEWLYIFSHADAAQINSEGVFDFTKQAKDVWSYLDREVEALLLQQNNKTTPVDDLINERQYGLLLAARDELTWAQESLIGERPLELAGQNLRRAEEHLQRAVGRSVSQEYIGEIFRQFCLGK